MVMKKSEYFNIHGLTEDEKDAVEALAVVRYPKVLFVGKPIDHENLLRLMVYEEPCFDGWDYYGNDYKGNRAFRNNNSILGDFLHRDGSSGETSMVLADGTIYGSFNAPLWFTRWNIFLTEYEELAERHPFLDMVVVLTNASENPCEGCHDMNKSLTVYSFERIRNTCKWSDKCNNYCLPKIVTEYGKCVQALTGGEKNITGYNEYANEFMRSFCKHNMPINVSRCILITLHIHDGVVDFLVGDKARNKYLEYDNMYGDFRMSILNDPNFFGVVDKKRVHFNNAFMRECCSTIGTPEIWDEKIAPAIGVSFDDNDVEVITKDWLVSKYDEAFKNTPMEYIKIQKILNKYKLK